MGKKAFSILAVVLACGDNNGGEGSDTGASTTMVASASSSSGQADSTTGNGTDAIGTESDGGSQAASTDFSSTGVVQDTTTGEDTSASTTHDSTGFITTNSDATTTTDTGAEEGSSGTTGVGQPGPEMGPYSSCLDGNSCEPGDWTRGVGPMNNPFGCVCSADCDENMACPPVEGINAVPTCLKIQVAPNQFADMCKLGCDVYTDCFDGMVCEDVGYGKMCIYGEP